MKGIINMLFNTATQQWHPILFLESYLPGSLEGDQTITRLKSKGHSTNGFDTKQAAIDSLDENLISPLKAQGYDLLIETDEDIAWDGEGMPLGVVIRALTDWHK